MADEIPAESRRITHTYTLHFPEHLPREGDPHYRDFDAYRRKTRAAARCHVGERIGFDWCRDTQGNRCTFDADGVMSDLELHHAHIEFALQNGISLAALEKDYPGVSNPDQVGAWINSAENLLYLCTTPETEVLMADGAQRRVEDVQIGDLVIGHDGEAHQVTGTGRRRYSGPILSLTPTMGLTPNHEVFTSVGWSPIGQVVNQLGMLGTDVLGVRGIESQVLGSVIGAVTVDVMDPLRTKQGPAKDPLHYLPMLQNMTSPIINADVSLPGNPSGAITEIPLRQLIQAHDPAFVATELGQSRSPIGISGELPTTNLADKMLWLSWIGLPRFTSRLYSGWVHDLSVAHSHSFIAGGVAIHNCPWHHRGAGGAHTAAHADWEASCYVLGLIS